MKNDLSSTNGGKNTVESLTPAELMRKHVKDPNHHVTDEELRNLKVGAEAEIEEVVNEEASDLEKEIENMPDNDSLPNPYQVLG